MLLRRSPELAPYGMTALAAGTMLLVTALSGWGEQRPTRLDSLGYARPPDTPDEPW